MIKINDKYEFKKYPGGGWVLHTTRDGTNKDGKPTKTVYKSYFPHLEQILDKIIDNEAGECQSVAELRELLIGCSPVTGTFKTPEELALHLKSLK